MAYKPDHAAILVGISRYSDNDLPDLDGPLNDVTLLQNWLTDESKGGVDPKNIRVVRSDPKITEKTTIRNIPPLIQDYMDKFMEIVEKPDGTGYDRRPQGRIYLYFSGHGFSQKKDKSAHAAVYAGNCRVRNGPYYNIYGTAFAQWIKNQGLFKEVILVMDCCRDAEATKIPSIPPLPESGDVGVGNAVRLLEIYAAPRGGKAQERPIEERKGVVHGLLTHVLVEALDNAAPGKAEITSAEIKTYIEQRWSAVCGASPINPPEIFVPQTGDISFNRPPNREAGVQQRFNVAALSDGHHFAILDGNLNPLLNISIERPFATVSAPDGSNQQKIPIAADSFSLELPVKLYKTKRDDATTGSLFQAGGEDVTV